MEQGALLRLLLGRAGHIDRLPRNRVDPRVVHGGGDGARRGIEILHLLGVQAVALQVAGQRHGVFQTAAGVRAHEIGHQILLLAGPAVERVILVAKGVKHGLRGLAHAAKHVVRDVFGGDLELAAHVVLHELSEKGGVFVEQHIVKAKAAAHEHLFDAGQRAHLAQNVEILGVVDLQMRAGIGGKTAPVGTCADSQLLLAGRAAEVGGWAADVVDIPLEVRRLCQPPRLLDDGGPGTAGDGAALVQGQSAEVTGAKAAPVVDDGKFDFGDGGHAARRLIRGVGGVAVGQFIDVVELLCCERAHGGILPDKARAVLLVERPAAHGVLLAVLGCGGRGIGLFVVAQRLKIGQ